MCGRGKLSYLGARVAEAFLRAPRKTARTTLGADRSSSHSSPGSTRTVADRLIIRGAREHNLRDVSLDLPRDALIVFTGLSGSGKSSLAFDTIFAEGQRRYVESLSSYARQFLGQMDKPDVDFIEGLQPGRLHRPEVHLAQPALDRRHHHRGLRLPAPALRPHRRAALPGLRRADQQAEPAADRRPGAGDGRGHQVHGARPGGPRPQGRVRRPVRRAAGQGLRPGPGRRRGAPADRAAEAEEAGEAHHRGGDRPAQRQGERQAAADRLGRGRARPVRRHGAARLRRPGRGRPGPRAPLLRAPGLPQRPPAGDRGPRAPGLLLQRAVRRLPRVHRPGHQEGGRPGAARPRPGAHPARGRDPALVRPGTTWNTSCACWRRSARPSTSTSTPRGGRCRRGRRRRSCTAPTTRCTSATATSTAASAPTTPASRAWCSGSSAGTPTPRAMVARQVRGLHARRALRGLRRHPAQARGAGGHHRRQEHRRGLQPVGGRVRRAARRHRADRPAEDDRRAGAQGDQRPAAVPARRRPGLPLPGPRRPAPSPAARRSASGWPPRSAPAWSACSTCSTSRRSACTSGTTTG